MIVLISMLLSSVSRADLVTQVESSRAKIEQAEIRQREVLSALYELNKKIHKSVSERAKLQGARASLEESVRRLNEDLAELDRTSTELRARLGERLKAIHRLGGVSMARVLSSANNASTLDRNLKILGLVAARDRNLFREYAMLKSEVKIKRTKVANRLAKLTDVERDVQARESRLVAEQSVKNKLLDGIRRKHLFAEKNLADLRRQTIEAPKVDDAVLDLLFKPSFADERGRLPAPVVGKIRRGFGPERSKEQYWTLTHKGVRFASAAGEAIKAVFDGTVAWVGSIPGFGNTVVVDHGDHYYTVYGNAISARVQAGEEVRRAQAVATAGDAVYFEIRHFSEPYDPQLWLKGTAL